MRAVVVYPGQDRPPEVSEVDEPKLRSGAARVRVLEVGVCGTDREILAGGHGHPPPGEQRLVLGHESFGRVEDVDGSSGVRPGDYVVATVRRPCGRCSYCERGMSDFCLTGGFVERGILGMDGYLAERYVESPEFLVTVPERLKGVGVLLEPLSVVEKALQQALAGQARVPSRPTADFEPWREDATGWRPESALVLGAGPIGLLAALLLRLIGVPDVLAVERTSRPMKEDLLRTVGARYLATGGASLRDSSAGGPFDLLLEATGSAPSVVDALPLLGPNGVAVLTGIFAAGQPPQTVDLNALFREMVYRNKAIVTSVNSNRSYFERGVRSMGALEERWPGAIGRLITRRMPMERYAEAVEPERDGVKTVIEVAAG